MKCHQIPGVSDYSVGFVWPCPVHFTGGECCTYNFPTQHGHLVFETVAGIARPRFCCFSQDGVKWLLNRLWQEYRLSEAMDGVIMNLPAVQALPVRFLEVEKRVIRSPKKWRRDLDLCLIG